MLCPVHMAGHFPSSLPFIIPRPLSSGAKHYGCKVTAIFLNTQMPLAFFLFFKKIFLFQQNHAYYLHIS